MRAGCHIPYQLALPSSFLEVLSTHITPHHFRQLLPPKTFQLNGCQEYSRTYFRALKTSLAFKFEANQFIVRKTYHRWHVRRGTNLQQEDTSMQLGLQLITSSASTAGTGKSCANKPLLLSSENPDSMDQILTSRTAEETVCVY